MFAGPIRRKSSVFVPIVGSDRVARLDRLENYQRENAFGEAKCGCCSTVASSMGVALENARLFDETQRLLKETEQRNAELAVINSIQQGIAGSLVPGASSSWSATSCARCCDIDNIGIRWYDHARGRSHFLYEIEHGTRVDAAADAVVARRDWRRRVIATAASSCAIPRREVAAASESSPGTDCSLSVVAVPIVVGERVVGVVVVENFEREYAFGDTEVRLLQTIVASMGVALENARLFDETQRLLKETEQRNAELAVINSIQQGMAGELDFQAIVDLVGDKLREVFRVGDIGIRWCDERDRTAALPVRVRARRARVPLAPMPRRRRAM